MGYETVLKELPILNCCQASANPSQLEILRRRDKREPGGRGECGQLPLQYARTRECASS
jgi:hypothetical protein